jgi:hypothetical protein
LVLQLDAGEFRDHTLAETESDLGWGADCAALRRRTCRLERRMGIGRRSRLVLLRHSRRRLCRTERAFAQHGQRSSVAAMPTARTRRSVAIESGT